MRIFLSIVLSALVVALPAQGGTITGNVRAEGRTAPGAGTSDGAYSSRKFKFVEKVDYTTMRDFVVYIDGGITNSVAPTNSTLQVTTERVAQQGAMFTPHVLPVQRGAMVEWPNYDEIFHNVFSVSDAKSFDLDLYKGNPPGKQVTFDRSGRVDVFCSIHERMHCIVLVLDNPHFASADEKGNYRITNVPAGTYILKAWHDRLPTEAREITVPADGEVRADFVLGVKNLPKH
ncbi:MAG TPA: carboxypeptidase regulatory-like domain-containing protein [Verrucomicrobiae bacterium]|nr:carboxypeptidase regulatory-like domain-containing protein [Verrucomicrobiae bacterium]